jgi:hypothetical protein
MRKGRSWPSTPAGLAIAGITFNLFEVSMWTLPLWMEVRFLALFFIYGNAISELFLRSSGAGGHRTRKTISLTKASRSPLRFSTCVASTSPAIRMLMGEGCEPAGGFNLVARLAAGPVQGLRPLG